MRKIIQIIEINESLTVLCNDGTIWYVLPSGDGTNYEWQPIKNIPQHAVES